MSTKEKTKADLLTELNEKLENENQELKKRNEELIDEIRVAKSNNASLEVYKDIKDNYEKLLEENNGYKKKIGALIQEKLLQERQINVLLNGLNNTNICVNRLFENLNYTLHLAKENYDATFNNIQVELDKLNQKDKEENE